MTERVSCVSLHWHGSSTVHIESTPTQAQQQQQQQQQQQMTDVGTLVGTALGGQVVTLAYLVLNTDGMIDGSRLRHFSVGSSSGDSSRVDSGAASAAAAADRKHLQRQIESVVGYLDGTFAASRPSVQQRYPGNDAARMLRAPLLLHTRDGDFVRCFLDALGLLCPGTRYGAIDAERRCPLLLFKDRDDWISSLMVHAESSVPIGLQELARLYPQSAEAVYLSEAEKLTLLLLLTQTKAVRDDFVVEANRPLQKDSRRADRDWWLKEEHKILTSTRVALLPFTRWLCHGGTGPYASSPPCSDRAYLPVSEDNHPLTEIFGRVFDALLPVEIVHYTVHEKHDSFFTNCKKEHVNGPPIKPEQMSHVVMAVCFLFFRLTHWELEATQLQKPNALPIRVAQSFPEFLRFALEELPKEEWEKMLPCQLHPAKQVLLELKDALVTGGISSGTKSTLKNYMNKGLWAPNSRSMSPERLLIGVLQIASVLFTRDKKTEAHNAAHAVWQYTPVRFLNPKMMRDMAPHTAPTTAFASRGLLISNTSAALMQMMMKTLLCDLNFIAVEYKEFRLDMDFVDVIHPIATHNEVWCLASIKGSVTTSLRALKTYMHACAIRCNPPVALDAQAMLSLMAAIVSAGPDLFHWLNAFRIVIADMKKPETLMSIDSDGDGDGDGDDDNSDRNFAVDLRQDFLRIRDVLERIKICCSPNFVPAMLRAAVLAENQQAAELDGPPAAEPVHGPVQYLLSQVPWLLCSQVALTRKGFWRLMQLWPDFIDTFTASDAYRRWTEAEKQTLADKVEHIGTSIEDSEEDYFDELPYVGRDDSPPPPSPPSHASSSSGSSSSSGAAEGDLPQRILLTDDLILCIMQSALGDIDAGHAMQALRKVAQLKAVTRLPRERLQRLMPIVFHECALKGMRIDSTTCQVERINLLTPASSIGSTENQQQNAPSFRAIASYFGGELRDTTDEWLSALAQQRLFVKGHSADEIMRPLDQQVNMFGGELASMSARLVKQLLAAKREDDAKQIIAPLFQNAKTLNQRKPADRPSKKQNTGIGGSGSSSAPKGAAAAVAAATPASPASAAPQSLSLTQHASAASAASAVSFSAYRVPDQEMDASGSYSPSHPGYDDESADPAPSGMTDMQTDECSAYMLAGAHEIDPDLYQQTSGSTSSRSKRKAH